MEHEEKQTSSLASSNGGFLWIDFCLLVVISILYGIGRDNSWGIRAGEFLLIYILLKSGFILTRWITCGLNLVFTSIGNIVTLIFNFWWILGVSVYYIFTIVEFFKDSNDWKQNANSLWSGMVVIITEGILALFLLLVILLIYSWIYPFQLQSIVEKNRD